MNYFKLFPLLLSLIKSRSVRFLIVAFVCIGFPTFLRAPEATNPLIVLIPYAQPANPGRTINKAFERGIALQYADELKLSLQTKLPAAEIVIMSPEEQKKQEILASTSNQLQPTLVLALSFFQESSPQPTAHGYRYSRADDLPLKTPSFALIPYDQAHRLSCLESKKNLTTLISELSANNITSEEHALPISQLIGISAPACLIEWGIPQDYDWHNLIEPLAQGVAHVCA